MNIYPIAGLLNNNFAIAPCPKGNDMLANEIISLKNQGYDIVVSMLTAQEQELHGLKEEKAICEANGIRYINYPIRDEVAENDDATIEFVRKLKEIFDDCYEPQTKVLFHCRGGVGRSSMMLALTMANYGINVDDIFEKISRARGEDTPETTYQLKWVKELASRL